MSSLKTKTSLERKLTQAWKEGESNTYLEDILLEEASICADEIGYENDKEFNMLIEAYRDGFLGQMKTPWK